jgi:hypothetical protein
VTGAPGVVRDALEASTATASRSTSAYPEPMRRETPQALPAAGALTSEAQRLERMLAGGDRHLLEGIDEVIGLVLANPSSLSPLFECLLSSDKVVCLRASHAIDRAMRGRPGMRNP